MLHIGKVPGFMNSYCSYSTTSSHSGIVSVFKKLTSKDHYEVAQSSIGQFPRIELNIRSLRAKDTKSAFRETVTSESTIEITGARPQSPKEAVCSATIGDLREPFRGNEPRRRFSQSNTGTARLQRRRQRAVSEASTGIFYRRSALSKKENLSSLTSPLGDFARDVKVQEHEPYITRPCAIENESMVKGKVSTSRHQVDITVNRGTYLTCATTSPAYASGPAYQTPTNIENPMFPYDSHTQVVKICARDLFCMNQILRDHRLFPQVRNTPSCTCGKSDVSAAGGQVYLTLLSFPHPPGLASRQ